MSAEPTTRHSVDLIRQLFASGNDRAYGALERLFASDAILDLTRQGLGTYEGANAVRRFCEGWIEVYEQFVLTATDVVDLGSGVVLTVNRHSGRYRGSNVEVILDNAWVFVCRHDAIVRWTAYDESEEARVSAEALTPSEA